MGWFTWGPEERFKQASEAINRWWDSIENTVPAYAHGLVKIIHLGPVTFILSPSPEIMRSEYQARRGRPLALVAAGITEPLGAGEYEIYALYKLTKAGNEVINQWTLTHELCHVFQIIASMADPDGVETAEFYE